MSFLWAIVNHVDPVYFRASDKAVGKDFCIHNAFIDLDTDAFYQRDNEVMFPFVLEGASICKSQSF